MRESQCGCKSASHRVCAPLRLSPVIRHRVARSSQRSLFPGRWLAVALVRRSAGLLERWNAGNAGLLSAADGASVVRRSAPGTAVSGPGSGGWRTTRARTPPYGARAAKMTHRLYLFAISIDLRSVKHNRATNDDVEGLCVLYRPQIDGSGE